MGIPHYILLVYKHILVCRVSDWVLIDSGRLDVCQEMAKTSQGGGGMKADRTVF